MLGSEVEMGGWAARLASAQTVKWSTLNGGYWDSSKSAYIAQYALLHFTCVSFPHAILIKRLPLSIRAILLSMAPAWLVAGCYAILGVIITRYGERYCRLDPERYTRLFSTLLHRLCFSILSSYSESDFGLLVGLSHCLQRPRPYDLRTLLFVAFIVNSRELILFIPNRSSFKLSEEE